ncbi:hypothetical protein GTW43_33355 [Streptomyces sp. SID5785]|uniref:hypothetical protein n=1 Tax=Streptomyces sp. SID5785 TaxID=2690309 RepID=UPI001361C1F6|nr:hypothetical protein [Streptomyces sp. SID5785]MZD09934.1 hypothetical protein [Streptomyces sp. SID5785]
MPEPIRRSRRTWIAGWAVLCAAGVAVTVALDRSSTPQPPPEKTVSAECAQYLADVDRQLAEADRKGGKILAFSRIRDGAAEDCSDELRDHLRELR